MSRGVLMFAFDSDKYSYTSMASFVARRVHKYLNLPVAVVTDSSIVTHVDQVINSSPDKSNSREWGTWINKNRYQAYELSPFDETLLIDTDYLVNSNTLLKLFDMTKDIMAHDRTSFMMNNTQEQEQLSLHGLETLWATVICFKKTQLAKDVFDCMRMVQENYQHYSSLHGFPAEMFRNDYALTIAMRLAQGHLLRKENIIPWDLLHVGHDVHTHYDTNTNEFIFTKEITKNNKSKIDYLSTRNIDFHMLNKDDLVNIIEDVNHV